MYDIRRVDRARFSLSRLLCFGRIKGGERCRGAGSVKLSTDLERRDRTLSEDERCKSEATNSGCSDGVSGCSGGGGEKSLSQCWVNLLAR